MQIATTGLAGGSYRRPFTEKGKVEKFAFMVKRIGD